MAKNFLVCFGALLLGLAIPALAAEETNTPPPNEDSTVPANGPSGFSGASASAKSEGKTGENAECPIKKEVNGKTICFQNDPALTKPQGGQ